MHAVERSKYEREKNLKLNEVADNINVLATIFLCYFLATVLTYRSKYERQKNLKLNEVADNMNVFGKISSVIFSHDLCLNLQTTTGLLVKERV